MLNTKKLLYKMLDWMGTTSNASATKVGNIWTNGSIYFVKRGNIVQVNGSPTLGTFTGRQTIAQIPVGFRPATTAYAILNGNSSAGNYFIFNGDGTIQANTDVGGKTLYFGTCYIVR